jgi:hypothetical protein
VSFAAVVFGTLEHHVCTAAKDRPVKKYDQLDNKLVTKLAKRTAQQTIQRFQKQNHLDQILRIPEHNSVANEKKRHLLAPGTNTGHEHQHQHQRQRQRQYRTVSGFTCGSSNACSP